MVAKKKITKSDHFIEEHEDEEDKDKDEEGNKTLSVTTKCA